MGFTQCRLAHNHIHIYEGHPRATWPGVIYCVFLAPPSPHSTKHHVGCWKELHTPLDALHAARHRKLGLCHLPVRMLPRPRSMGPVPRSARPGLGQCVEALVPQLPVQWGHRGDVPYGNGADGFGVGRGSAVAGQGSG